mmetsp:Transcript_78695/g.217600  ORF Transcript_78695/g.217600 Transcript_78695/m.217600 type:complete len:282 (+) Transcript_78695:528-1373(+)
MPARGSRPGGGGTLGRHSTPAAECPWRGALPSSCPRGAPWPEPLSASGASQGAPRGNSRASSTLAVSAVAPPPGEASADTSPGEAACGELSGIMGSSQRKAATGRDKGTVGGDDGGKAADRDIGNDPGAAGEVRADNDGGAAGGGDRGRRPREAASPSSLPKPAQACGLATASARELSLFGVTASIAGLRLHAGVPGISAGAASASAKEREITGSGASAAGGGGVGGSTSWRDKGSDGGSAGAGERGTRPVATNSSSSNNWQAPLRCIAADGNSTFMGIEL